VMHMRRNFRNPCSPEVVIDMEVQNLVLGMRLGNAYMFYETSITYSGSSRVLGSLVTRLLAPAWYARRSAFTVISRQACPSSKDVEPKNRTKQRRSLASSWPNWH
jgi:hypothetical protein